MNNNQNMLDVFFKKSSKKLAIGCGVFFCGFIIFITMMYVIIESMNTVQGLFDNIGNNKNEVEKVLNAFDLVRPGVEGEQLYKFLNELASKYNSLEEDVQRETDFDLPLILATLHYEKLFKSDVYKEGFLDYEKLTNREISNFLNDPIETEYEYKMFYKWAYLMVGTPYSIPNINLRGLTGSLISGKVVSQCVANNKLSKNDVPNQTQKQLLEAIIDSELEFAGREAEGESKSNNFIDWILKLFSGSEKDHIHNAYEDEIRTKVYKAYNERSETLEPFLNFDQYNPDIECGAGTSLVHRYIRTMHYEQYKVYLKEVFIPQNFLDCEECLYKNVDEELRARVTSSMIRDIFDFAGTFYKYADLEPVNYNTIENEGTPIPPAVLAQMTSPLGNNSCVTTSGYTDLRGAYAHHAFDTIITGNPNEIIGKDVFEEALTRDSLISVADGIVKEVTVLTDKQLPYDPKAGTCTVNMNLNGGIYIIIEHEIYGKKYDSKYYHLKKDSIVVKEGDTVKKGQKIAEIGTTGCSTGEHLHFEFYDHSLKANLNPNTLFSNCKGWDENYTIKLPTTDDYYADIMITVTSYEGSPSGTFPLEEYITGVVKAELGGVAGQSQATINGLKEAIKAQAIAARTYAMKITDWGKNPIQNSSNNQNMDLVDVKGYASDKWIYEIVLETQGMVMTTTSDIFMSEYMNWPCQRVKEEKLTLGKLNDEDFLTLISYILSFGRKDPEVTEDEIIKPEDFPSRYEDRFWYTDKFGIRHFNEALYKSVTIDPINEQLSEIYGYMSKSCSWYYNGSEGAQISIPLFYAIKYKGLSVSKLGVDLIYQPWGNDHYFEIPMGYIKNQYYGHNRGMTQIGAKYLNELYSYGNKEYNYVGILNEFYRGEAGETEILTAPSLVRIFADEEDFINKSFTFFEYGAQLPGSDNWHPCRADKEYDDMLAEELDKYEDQAEINAIVKGDINPMRVKVVAAAYWLAYNPYFKVQYDLGGKHPYEGINNKWGCQVEKPEEIDFKYPPSEFTEGLDCNAFVRWAFAQVGKDDITLGEDDGPRRIEIKGDTGLTVGQIASVAQLGDVLIKNAEEHGDQYGHVALVFSVDREAGTFSVIHSNGYGTGKNGNITITEYKNSGKRTEYNWVLSMSKVYDDDEWEDSKGE